MLLATTADKVNSHVTCALSIVLRAHPFSFRAKLVLSGFFPATDSSPYFLSCFFAETQVCMTKSAQDGAQGMHSSA